MFYWKIHDCPPPFVKAGDFKTHSSVCLSLCLSVTKTLTWLISSEVLMIEHWYLTCMILVIGPFNWHHAVTLTFDLLQGQICCRAGDHNSPNLLVYHSDLLDELLSRDYAIRIPDFLTHCQTDTRRKFSSHAIQTMLGHKPVYKGRG